MKSKIAMHCYECIKDTSFNMAYGRKYTASQFLKRVVWEDEIKIRTAIRLI